MSTNNFNQGYDPQDIEQNKVMAILAYFGPLFLVPYLAAKGSAYAKFNANQGLLVFILEVIVGIINFVLGFLSIIPGIGFIFSLISWVLYAAVGILAILGIINAATGKANPLPIIGGITILK